MEVKPGYKKTEIGVIPEDWDAPLLGAYASFRTGPFGSALHKSDYISDGIPVINPMHINDGVIEPTSAMTITEEAAATLSEFRLRRSEIIIGRRGEMGRCAVVQPKQEGWICGTGSMIVRPHKEFDSGFLARLLSTPRVISDIVDASVGSTMTNLNQGTLANLRLQCPPAPEQRAIVQALSDVDASITALARLIAKQRDIREGAMQRLLTGKARLPGFTAPWQEKRLGQCLLQPTSYGINAPAVPFSDRLPRYIRITDISDDGRFDPRPLVCVAAATSQYLLEPGDLVFARTGASVGKSYLYEPSDGELVYAGFLIRVRPNPNILVSKFLAGLTTTRPYWNWVKLMSMRTGQPGINGREYEQFGFLCPEVAEQTAIAEILSDMDKGIASLKVRLDKTCALKQAMMQALLTGRVRLPVKRDPVPKSNEAVHG